MGEVTDEFAKNHVIPNAVTVQFSEAVMTRQEWIENDCPMRMTAEQIAQWCKSGIELADDAEEVAFQEYKAKRKAETAEAVAQMKAGTFKVRPLYSYESHPCTMPDDNGRIYEGLE
jgi:hypothetical protein